ncbi:metalloregulator ArsR/SmtB family transcription factor [Corynebacterium sp. P3-F1]|uniref:ArsR/SmtB family transcription factor n=1 Tax=Corynebacterium sp. P3-F1 TaxID=3059080 RepID=UPI00265D4F72|nr:metalloregulator ArsR/SmtB family transcription factor [Corynebacterium sp. P3-F1]WKK61939.1 metalloregulator ArsR/SmtB family transcription factor [Corynebacterium sp. P3-F1]
MSHPANWSGEKMTRTSEIIGALDSPLRLRILLLLSERDHVVHELVDSLDKSQPLVSQHLRVLKKAGLVDATRSGREVVYHLAVPGVIATLESLSTLPRQADDDLAARRQRTPDFIDATESTGSAAAFGPLPDSIPERDPGLTPNTPAPPM